ncbi:PD-(D/E)XK nuclease family protein [Methanothrix sp.]|uniref:CRISPR-associated protein Cas4 n=1 Tax=Methanothrix sp. TaxID=90426 RepID=UPI002CA99580|nr:PD-(D/E)XK nuclease family protein [Methanothrix sp.]HOK57731.1 Dna2/Cas4 domain-containing protein [Methanothrix sp.]HOL43134.1 Dna2/Cas4 domain-containing protein [Methanothrix sp.]HPO88136.1 Dna2/Cas4 domain-containing protein [Methanothrix sp.]
MFVRIHDIGLYLRCPMLVYLESMGRECFRADTARTLLRHLALYSAPDDLRGDLSKVVKDVATIHRIPEEDVIRSIDGMRESISRIASVPRELVTPCDIEVELRSERLGLSGILDRLVRPEPRQRGLLGMLLGGGAQVIPSLVRTGRSPGEGVWRRDRIQLAGYALLLEERFGVEVSTGQVEYVREGEIRRVRIRGVDRSRALWVRDRVREIRDGEMPDVGNERCNSCEMIGICGVKSCVVSRML